MFAKGKVCLVAASEMTVKAFLKDQIVALADVYDVTLVLNTTRPEDVLDKGVRAQVVPVVIERSIAPWRDLRALFALWKVFRRYRFDLIHSVTPKAGLLAMVAGMLAGVPRRLHTFTGQVWATRSGFPRFCLKFFDRVLAFAATQLLADSPSQRQFLIDEGIVRPERIHVLEKGSISGVDLGRFCPDAAARKTIRSSLAIGEKEIVFLFVGRMNRDKGVLDLATAFVACAREFDRIHLLLVGPDEEGLDAQLAEIVAGYSGRVHRVPFTVVPEQFMAAAEVLCLPSYREGFGSVIIEAAAVGIPAIGSEIYGITDAIERDKTGLLFPAGNVDSLSQCMRQFAADPPLRIKMGQLARQRAEKDFDSKMIVAAWLAYYRSLGLKAEG